VLLLLCAFYESIDHVAQHMQRLVDVTPLSQSLPLDVGVLDSLAACKVDYVDLGLSELYCVLFHDF